MKRKIIIAGISGQDASFLCEKLNTKFSIIGLTRSNNKKKIFIKKYLKKIKIINTNYSYNQICRIIKKYEPKFIYNLASQSNPKQSWFEPLKTNLSISNITLNFLEAIKNYDKNIKFFNASTSEIFGNTRKRISENSYINPENPYGCSKAFSHNIVKAYRKKYDMFAVNGILFNHESTRRESNYIIKKLVKEGLEIKKGKRKFIYLESTSHIRDFSYAGEAVAAMIKMVNYKYPTDFIIASGISIHLKTLVNEICNQLSISKKNIISKNDTKKIISIRKANINLIKKKLKWEPKLNYKRIIKKMIKDEINNG